MVSTPKCPQEFGSQPIRVKNMFSYDDKQWEDGLHYKTVMINWLFNPGISYGEMAQESEALWKQYYDFAIVPGVGKKAPSVSWTEWRERIEAGTSFLRSAKWMKRPVQKR